MECEWFYDVISPFAYLQLEQFHRLPEDLVVVARPIVLGAVLSHWETRGPAEIPEKRRLTYRMAHWRGIERGIPFRMPPAHPFNPLRALRLAIACGETVDAARTIFRFIWRDGLDFSAEEGWTELCGRLGIGAEDRRLGADDVKARLRANTDDALAKGVFGVPTFIVNGQLFWGEDATGLLLAYLGNPRMFEEPEWARISDLPVGVQRRT
jgi:2-hydroxychromene-2-carboxylate isomerase